jgi:hypothetical protein
MSLRETRMTVWYWEQVGGALIEEFMATPKQEGQGRRLLDGLIVLGEPKQRLPVGSRFNIEGRDVIVIQTKNSRLGMYLMGQTLFSAQLIKRFFNPRSVQSVALCAKNDLVLQPMLEIYEGCKVVVCPPEIIGLTSGSRRA